MDSRSSSSGTDSAEPPVKNFVIGSSFFRPRGRDGGHPWVVASRPDNSCVVTLNVTDAERWSDKSCIITPEQHKSLSKDSAVAYERAELERLQDLESDRRCGALIIRDKFSDQVMQDIFKGAEKTKQLKRLVRNILEDQELIGPSLEW